MCMCVLCAESSGIVALVAARDRRVSVRALPPRERDDRYKSSQPPRESLVVDDEGQRRRGVLYGTLATYFGRGDRKNYADVRRRRRPGVVDCVRRCWVRAAANHAAYGRRTDGEDGRMVAPSARRLGDIRSIQLSSCNAIPLWPGL